MTDYKRKSNIEQDEIYYWTATISKRFEGGVF